MARTPSRPSPIRRTASSRRRSGALRVTTSWAPTLDISSSDSESDDGSRATRTASDGGSADSAESLSPQLDPPQGDEAPAAQREAVAVAVLGGGKELGVGEQWATLRTQLQLARADAEESEEENRRLRARLRDLAARQAEHDSASATMRAVGRQCSEELRRMRQENERLAAEAQAQRQREAALEAEVGGIEGARDVLETRLVDAESRARLAAAGRATLQEELVVLRTATARAEVEREAAALAEHGAAQQTAAQIAALEAALAEAQQHHEAEQERRRGAEESRDALAAQLLTSQAEAGDRAAAVAAAEREATDLRAQLAAVGEAQQAELSSLSGDAERVAAQLGQLQTAAEAVAEEERQGREDAEATAAALRGRAATLEDELAEARQECERSAAQTVLPRSCLPSLLAV